MEFRRLNPSKIQTPGDFTLQDANVLNWRVNLKDITTILDADVGMLPQSRASGQKPYLRSLHHSSVTDEPTDRPTDTQNRSHVAHK